jgi:hypothetical protein
VAGGSRGRPGNPEDDAARRLEDNASEACCDQLRRADLKRREALRERSLD